MMTLVRFSIVPLYVDTLTVEVGYTRRTVNSRSSVNLAY